MSPRRLGHSDTSCTWNHKSARILCCTPVRVCQRVLHRHMALLPLAVTFLTIASAQSHPLEFNALQFACARGHVELVRGLLSLGARVNFANKQGYTPLHCAVIGRALDVCSEALSLHTSLVCASAVTVAMVSAVTAALASVCCAVQTICPVHCKVIGGAFNLLQWGFSPLDSCPYVFAITFLRECVYVTLRGCTFVAIHVCDDVTLRGCPYVTVRVCDCVLRVCAYIAVCVCVYFNPCRRFRYGRVQFFDTGLVCTMSWRSFAVLCMLCT